jgi:hypothetical protein
VLGLLEFCDLVFQLELLQLQLADCGPIRGWPSQLLANAAIQNFVLFRKFRKMCRSRHPVLRALLTNNKNDDTWMAVCPIPDLPQGFRTMTMRATAGTSE